MTWDSSGANPLAPVDGAGTWNTAVVNWSDGLADVLWPNTNADIAIFGANNGAAGTIAVGTVTANGITFNAAGSGSYALSGGTITFGGTTPTITANVDASIGSQLSGGAGLTKEGTGILTLSSATNNYTGGTTVNAGTLRITATAALQGATTVNPSGTLLLNAGNVTYANTFGGSGTVNVTTGNGDVTLSGAMSGFSGTLDLNQSVGSASKTRFTTTQANLISSGATIKVRAGTTLYLNQGLNYGAAVQLYGAGNSENLGALRLEAAANQTGSVTLFGNSFIGANASAATISGAIGQSGGSYGFTKLGNNTLTLSNAANSYTGGTTVTSGTLSLGNATALAGTGNLTMSGGSFSNAVAASLSNNITLNNASTFTSTGGTLALNGNITGSPNGNWNLTATNKITLGGSNSITNSGNFAGLIVTGAGGVDVTGSTTINGAAANQESGYLSLAGNSAITVKSTGSLAINGTSNAGKPNSIIGQNAAGTSTLLLDGGTLTIGGNTGFALGNNVTTATGVLTVSSGTATINRGSTTATDIRSFVALGRDLANGTINLNGGILATDRNFVRDGSGGANGGTANFVFGGGTLKALANQADWLNSSLINTNQQALSSVTTTSAASTIDANGFAVGINSAISGAGGFTVIDSSGSGYGVVTFGGVNTYNGATAVNSGKLELGVNGSINNTSGVSLGNGGTFDVSAKAGGYTVNKLTGSGDVIGSLTVSTQLAIGNSPGTTSFDDLALGTGATYTYELTGGGTAADLGNVSGTLTLVSGTILDLVQLGTYTMGNKFTLFGYATGSLAGTFSDTGNVELNDGDTFSDAGGLWQIDYDDTTAGLNGGIGTRFVTVTAVPEPGAALLGGLGMLAFLHRRRR
ncbi:autotransporter-associated beta strand repeat-containing protein [Luteolibacter arcticus]|uniref:Autotransporter-associated beta strand repeat-containing protein n=1 Tax=Luteolibacter arcticus TaxID=1581411 RepID=A0ABT3GQG6_9BACT|nr:autotransporter-associated beta strand repeat-containing protein [Luteolibacter arcticus]MCW1925732.1 autotransporter-associated beta strand repeat-containing protein [Luteolibacter arcticus]